ncbi:ArsR/SmtB family transcription factor [Arthrobacter rhombi]|uniref:ArsR/SmtB family transcription factor n=1 Tax=Arthrobacter rhombi TaxID=71253 RepID=UPI003FD10166
MTFDDFFSVLADPTRRRILEALREEENSVGDLVQLLEVSQPTVSKHLKVLREAGVLRMRADGQRRIYSVEPGALHRAASWLAAFPGHADAEMAVTAITRAEYKKDGSFGNDLDTATVDDNAGEEATVRALDAAASYRSAQQRELEEHSARETLALEQENPANPGSGNTPQQLGRTVGRTVEQVTGRAQDLLERLQKPKFGRRR